MKHEVPLCTSFGDYDARRWDALVDRKVAIEEDDDRYRLSEIAKKDATKLLDDLRRCSHLVCFRVRYTSACEEKIEA